MKGGMRWANKPVQDLNYKYFNNFFCGPATRRPLLRPLDFKLGLRRPGTQSELENFGPWAWELLNAWQMGM